MAGTRDTVSLLELSFLSSHYAHGGRKIDSQSDYFCNSCSAYRPYFWFNVIAHSKQVAAKRWLLGNEHVGLLFIISHEKLSVGVNFVGLLSEDFLHAHLVEGRDKQWSGLS